MISSSISHDSSEILATLFAPSGKRYAFLKEVSDANGTKKRYVEVWSGVQLEASLEVTKQHGQFHTDGMSLLECFPRVLVIIPLLDYFKSFSFTPSESALVYTAEANPVTTEKLDDDPYPKFRFTPHFGEQLYTRKRPTLFVFRWRSPNESSRSGDETPTASVTALSLDQPPNVPVVFGQATFATETCLYATGYEQTGDGRLLGVKGCFNRPTGIWELILPSDSLEAATTTVCKSVRIDIPGRNARLPRILFDQDHVPTTLFWLSNPVGGAHASTGSLHSRDLGGTVGERLLVDAVHDPSTQEFPGLYTDNLADRPFLRLGDKTFMLVQSLWHSRPTLISIDVESGAVIDLTPVLEGQALHSWNLLGTDGAHSVICSRSTPTSPPEIILLTVAQGNQLGNVCVLDGPSISLRRECRRLKT